jgi:hypothetical protein
VLGLFVAPTIAQDNKVMLPGEVRQIAGRLAAAADLARRALWSDALDEYQRLMSEAGDDLVPLTEEGVSACQRSIQVRRLCHLRLAALPPEPLRMYRSRVEVQAEKWLRQGIAEHDPTLLRRVVDEAFCSRAAAKALNALGDLAFERGAFDEAVTWWRMLTPPADAPANRRVQELVCPDAGLDLVRVQAKQILARLYGRDIAGAECELKTFRRIHAAAPGPLGGRNGPYADTLRALIDQARTGPALGPQDWPTFGGSATRSRALPGTLSRRLWAEGPAWRARLDSGELIKPHGTADQDAFPGTKASSMRRRQPTCHPVITGDKAYIAHERRVRGFHLLSGQLLFHYDMPVPAGEPHLSQEQKQRASFTMTASDGLVYASLGTALLGAGKEGSRASAGSSLLVCLDPERTAPRDARQSVERWRIDARSLRAAATVFEGAPLVYQERVFVAFSSVVGSRAQTAIACFDAASGASRWRQDVCDSNEYEDQPAPKRRQNLLTLAGTQLVYCSHAGAIIALDAVTGKRTWAVRYPGRGNEDSGPTTPCIYDDGRVFAAPADSGRVICLDSQTGRVLWERHSAEAIQLIGIAEGRVFFTTPTGMRALNAVTGEDRGGWLQPDLGKLPGLGRGLLAGGWVLWPTQDPQFPVRALNQTDGSQQRGQETCEPTELRHLFPGNFAMGGGCLVIAGAEELAGYVPHPQPPALKPVQ